MRQHGTNKRKVAVNAALSLGVFLGAVAPLHYQSIAKAETKVQSQDILSKLTQEQRSALKNMQLNESSGLKLDPGVNLEGDEEISVIVEFKQKPEKVAQLEAALEGKDLSAAKARSLRDGDQATFQQDLKTIFKKEIQEKKASYKITHTYKNAFNGVSMTLPANKVKSLLSSDAVKAVWSNSEVQLDLPVQETETKQTTSATRMTSSNSYLGVDKLHQEGVTGKGIKVGVIDTGIDYKHPDLKDAYKGGYDFVDNDADPMETTYTDWKNSKKPEFSSNGSAYYTEHGTHVAGIIAGQGVSDSEYTTTGVAPDADLYAYRVLGPYGSGTTEAIMAAIDRAVADGMDVINLSLGASINDPLYPTSMAVNYAVLNGVTMVIAAGNSGNGMYTLGSPGAAALPLTVGASDVPIEMETFTVSMQASGQSVPAHVRLMAKAYSDNIPGLTGQTFSIVDVGIGKSTNYSGKDVKGKFVLVARGEITLQDKVKYAQQKGAAGILMYNNNVEEGFIPYYLGEGTTFIPTFSLSNAEGVALLEKVQAGNVTFTFTEMDKASTEGDALADFSSRGPSRVNYDIKPEIVAPGVSIMSTVPSYINNKVDQSNYQYAYQRLSGTSMASPYAAGVAALLLEANPDLQPEDVKSILMNTADPLKQPYSVFEVGAGRIDPYEAIHSEMKIQVIDETPIITNGEETTIKEKTGAISFGSFGVTGKDILESRKVVLSNIGQEDKTFDVAVEFQTGMRGSKDAKQNGVRVMTDSQIKIKGNKQKQTQVSIFVPSKAEKGTYEGYVVYTNKSNPNETYQVPFAIRVVEEGMGDLFFANPSMSTNPNDGNPIFSPYLYFGFSVKSHMKTIDAVLVDGKTGEELGYIGWIDGMAVNENVAYGWLNYSGSYLPFTGNKNQPISDKVVFAQQGHYKLKLIGTNDSGKTFTIEQDFFVDNTKPEFETNVDGKTVIEYPADQTSYPITATVIDNEVAEMQALGADVDQSINTVAFTYSGFSGYPDTIKQVDKNGHLEWNLPLDNRKEVITAHIDGLDGATNRKKRTTVYFLKEGTSYITGEMDKEAVRPGETMKYSLTAQNLKDLKEAKFTMKIDPKQVEIVDVKVRSEISAYGSVNMQHVSKPVGSYFDETYTLTMDGTKEVTGDIPMIDVYVKVKGETWMEQAGFLTFNTLLTDTAGKWKFAQPFFNKIKVYPTTSNVDGYVVSQGLLTETNAWNSALDYSTVGAKVKLTNAQGTILEQNLDRYSKYRFTNVPLTEKQYTVSIDVPGHFTYYDTVDAATKVGDMLSGKYALLRDAYLIAGDVNKDNVIDVMDALAIQEKWGTSDRAADINFDGIVNGKDIRFVQTNYLKENSTLEFLQPGVSPEAKKKYKGHTLESILRELGVE
ncbi:S8 family serine peptidase [Bacillus sp. 165]|uniref:S8 family serine peptidase n=1 Tax=Bacillus sp. 165 TaxID=1529117 RepID=UPI001ADC2F20|nr:S8 family serine peptidase [Bacillus sp. 165]MBO9129212.1 S8 family serine peptidase [Bacillus sp. 165]